MVGVDLRGLFQPRWFYDNMIYVHGMKMSVYTFRLRRMLKPLFYFIFLEGRYLLEAFGVEMDVLCCCEIVNLC